MTDESRAVARSYPQSHSTHPEPTMTTATDHLTVVSATAEHLPVRPPAVALLARARTLTAQARLVNPVVAQAYRRRADQLRREAHAHAGRPLPTASGGAPAAA